MPHCMEQRDRYLIHSLLTSNYIFFYFVKPFWIKTVTVDFFTKRYQSRKYMNIWTFSHIHLSVNYFFFSKFSNILFKPYFYEFFSYTYFVSGNTYSFMAHAAHDIGDVSDVVLHWHHESSLVNPFQWNPLGLRHPTLSITKVQIDHATSQ